MDPKVTMTTECRTSHNIYNIWVNTIQNINLKQTSDT